MNYGKILDIRVERHTVESIISGELNQFFFIGIYPHFNKLREKDFLNFTVLLSIYLGMDMLNRILNLMN
jgi:hypothetical protein